MNNGTEGRIVERREGAREKKYLKKVRNDVLVNLTVLWVTAIIVFLIAVANETWGKTLKRSLSGFVAAGASSILVYRIALNGATTRFGSLEANRVAEEAMRIAERGLAVEQSKLAVEEAKLVDGTIHEKAFNFVLLYSEVERYHVELCQDSTYRFLAKCQKLDKFRVRFPSQVDDAMQRARNELR